MSILTTDIVQHVCAHLARLSELNRLMRASKALHAQLAHHAHDHWLRIGRATCGQAHWNEALFTYTLGRVDGRYTAMLHACPWLSVPERLALDTLKAYGSMNVTVELQGLKLYEQRLDEDTPFTEPHNHDLHLRIHVHDSPHVKGGDRLVVRCARDAEAPDSLHVVEDWREEDSDEEGDNDLREAALLEELTDDDAFMRFASRYGLGELARVRIVHDQLCVALFAEGRTWRHSAMLFIAIHDRRLILHDLRFIDGHPECVAFSPGEMWYAGASGASGFIDYHGPRADRRLRPPTPKGDGRVARAFHAAANGRAEEALAVLAPMAIPNLSALYAPKTTLTLFDVAAGDTPQNSPLPLAATHLLQHEPRFAHGVFMMQRAIRAMDSDRMRALVEAGCPWISHDDVMAALPPGLGYEEAMEALRACRVRITYRY